MSVSRRNLMMKGLPAVTAGAVCAFAGEPAETKSDDEKDPARQFVLRPVGKVVKADGSVELRIFPKYADALRGLDGFSHIFVLYWFDKNDNPRKRGILQVHPRGNRNNPLTGVFACRSPVRPNLIALTLCKIRSVKDGIVRIDKIYAFDGSPILDIKPYIPSIDGNPKGIKLPEWLAG